MESSRDLKFAYNVAWPVLCWVKILNIIYNFQIKVNKHILLKRFIFFKMINLTQCWTTLCANVIFILLSIGLVGTERQVLQNNY